MLEWEQLYVSQGIHDSLPGFLRFIATTPRELDTVDNWGDVLGFKAIIMTHTSIYINVPVLITSVYQAHVVQVCTVVTGRKCCSIFLARFTKLVHLALKSNLLPVFGHSSRIPNYNYLCFSATQSLILSIFYSLIRPELNTYELTLLPTLGKKTSSLFSIFSVACFVLKMIVGNSISNVGGSNLPLIH